MKFDTAHIYQVREGFPGNGYKMEKITINASGIHYRTLNEEIRKLVTLGRDTMFLENICGQRYIGTGIKKKGVTIHISGTPGNDLGALMDGARIVVQGNAQDGTGNTMNSGEIIIHGNAGDLLGHSMRGGKIFVRGTVGYRVGIHMKEYRALYPAIVIGGTAGKFLGEYMAGGIIIILGIDPEDKKNGTGPSPQKQTPHLQSSENNDAPGQCIMHDTWKHSRTGEITGDFTGTGMHGGTIYIRGKIPDCRLGKEVNIFKADNDDLKRIGPHVEEFCRHFGLPSETLMQSEFHKIVPITKRPYGKLYAY